MGELVTESLYSLPHIQEENLNVPSLIIQFIGTALISIN